MEQLSLEEQTSRSIFSDVKPSIVRAFWQYHAENPHVYPLVIKYAKQVREAGRTRYSIVAVFERIRWHLTIETKNDDFKLNNNYRSCYARLLIYNDPSFAGFFETRHSPGTSREQ